MQPQPSEDAFISDSGAQKPAPLHVNEKSTDFKRKTSITSKPYHPGSGLLLGIVCDVYVAPYVNLAEQAGLPTSISRTKRHHTPAATNRNKRRNRSSSSDTSEHTKLKKLNKVLGSAIYYHKSHPI